MNTWFLPRTLAQMGIHMTSSISRNYNRYVAPHPASKFEFCIKGETEGVHSAHILHMHTRWMSTFTRHRQIYNKHTVLHNSFYSPLFLSLSFSLSLSFFLPLCLPLSLSLSIYLFIKQSIDPSVSLSLLLYLTFCSLSLFLSLSLYIYIWIYRSVYL